MAFNAVVNFPNLPEVPKFDPTDLNRGGGGGGAGSSRTSVASGNSVASGIRGPSGRPGSGASLVVMERSQSGGGGTDTETDHATNIVMSGKGVSFSPNVDHIFESSILSEDFRGDLPGYVFYTKDKASTLQMFRSYADLSEYLVNAATEGTRKDPETDVVVADILNVPLKHVAQQTAMGEYLRYLYANDRLMDVKIDVSGETFMAHRIVLGCYSNYLADLFYKSKRTKVPFELKINGISPEAFAAFLEFVYTGELHIVPIIAADLLLIADYLRVRVLQKRRGIINDYLPLDQIVKLVATSRDSVPDRALHLFIQQILAHFSEAARTKYFFDIDLETLCRILGSDDLVVKTECDVYKVAVDWIFYDLKHRGKHAERVLALVRYYYMTQDQFFTCVEMNSLARDTECSHALFRTANWSLTARNLGRPDPLDYPVPPPRNCYKYATNNNSSNKITSSPLSTPPEFKTPTKVFLSPTSSAASMTSPLMTSTPLTSPSKRPKPDGKRFAKPVMLPGPMQKMTSPIAKSVDILVVGGFQTENEGPPGPQQGSKDKWVHFCQLPEPMQNHSITLLSGKLYLVGGSIPEGDSETPIPVKRVSVMSVQEKQWSRVADMIEARTNHCTCAVGGKIYAIGGVGYHGRILASVECYSPTSDMWSYVRFMNVPRYAAAVATLGGMMYVTGGIGENTDAVYQVPILSDVEAYDPLEDRWTTKAPLRFPRCNSSLVNVGARLYLCGGATRSPDDRSALLVSVASVDEYLKKRDFWCHATDMVIPRHDAGVAVAGPRIYIIGGVSTTTDRVLQSIECYDTRASAWLSGLKDLPVPSRHIRCVSVVSEWRQMNPDNSSSS